MKLPVTLTLQKERLVFLLILIFATVFYLFNINYSDIWIDETFTKALVNHSFSDMIGLLKNDFHPPLYFFSLKIFVSIFGSGTIAIRLFSVLGVLSTIVLGYIAGRRVFGNTGALYFCQLLLSLPMLASYSHDARMYTWGAFTVTGVFLYASLYIASNAKKDLFLLMLFSLAAAYTHYYGLIAAFWANIFVVVSLYIKKNKNWRTHLAYALITALLYLPWLFILFQHTKKAQEFFWVPALTWRDFFACFILPFAQKFWISIFSLLLIIIVYALICWVIYRNYVVKKERHGMILGVSLFIFFATVLTTGIISIFSQPILYHRYIMIIAPMLMVPPALFFIETKNNLLKAILMAVILICGVLVSIRTSYFSYGPYKQSVEYLQKSYPEIKKIFHVFEVTAGPFIEYSSPEVENYWFRNEHTIVFTNMDVFPDLSKTDSIGEFLSNDEPFCVAGFPDMIFNQFNVQKIISESQLLRVDTVVDNKRKFKVYEEAYVNKMVLYILKYHCPE